MASNTCQHVRAVETAQGLAKHELRKRKHLETSPDNLRSSSAAMHQHKSPLKPVEVRGMGRLILHPDDLIVYHSLKVRH